MKKLSEFEQNVQCLVNYACITRRASGSHTMAEELINRSGFTKEEKTEALKRISKQK